MSVDAMQAEWHRKSAREFDSAMLRRWSDAQLAEAVEAAKAGHHDGTVLRVPGRPLPVMMDAVADEIIRRRRVAADPL